MHQHQVTNIVIELDGDKASSESYVVLAMRTQRDGKHTRLMVWSRYIDQWSRRDGRWGIDHRYTIMDFDEMREVTPVAMHDRGRRDREDPSYKAIRRIR
jgi:hypothetical protein